MRPAQASGPNGDVLMAADNAGDRDQRPNNDAAHEQPAPSPSPDEKLKCLLATVLTALPPDLLDRLVKSRVCFYAGDDSGRQRKPICLEIAGRCFAVELFPSGFLYLNRSQLLGQRPQQESLFLVARKVAEILLWQERNSIQPTLYDFQQLAEERARSWGFERPHRTLLEKFRNVMGLGGGS